MTHLRWILALVTSVLLALAGCSGDSNQSAVKLGQVKQALTGDQERILGLEDSSDYVATPTGVASLSTVAPLTQGSGAVRLAHPDQGWSSVCSAPMAHLGEVTSGTVSLDYLLEQETPYYGIIHLVLSFSTGGYEWVDLGEINIQGQTPGAVHTASWSLAPAATPLSQSYSSVKVCLLLGGIAGGYVFDDVDFGFPAGTTGTGGVTGTGGSDSTTDGTTGTGGDTTTDTTTTDASGGTGGTDSSGGTGGSDSSGGTGGTTSSDTGGSGGTGGSSGSGGTGGTGGTTGQCDPSTNDWDHLEIQIADRLDWKKVAVGSQGGHLELHDRVQVVDANGKFAPVSATGTPGDTFRTEIGAYAHVGDVASGNRVEQRVWSIVEGHIKTSKTYLPQQPETLTVTGGVYTNVAVEPYTTHEIPYQFPAGYAQEPSVIQNGVTYPLSPGAYGHVRVQANSRLELTGAEGGAYYYFNGGLNIESGNTLAIDNAQGPVFIFIDGEYTQRSPIEYTVPGQYNVLIGVVGSGTVTLDGPQHMILVAPDADITLPSVNEPQRHKGAFYGNSVIVHQDCVIEGHPFERNDCATADDGLGSAFGCEPTDSDGDGVSDCQEVADGTDPGGFNGLTATWYGVYGDLPDLTSFVDFADLRSYLDTLEVIESVRTTGGWDLAGAVGANPCSYDSGIEPRFVTCDSVADLTYDHWIVTLSGTLKTEVLGETCWQATAAERLPDGSVLDLPPEQRTNIWLNAAKELVSAQEEQAQCLDCGSKFCPIDIVISVTDTIRDIGVNWCRDNLQECIDSLPIGRPPSTPVEPQCDENECDERCPCGRGEGQCEPDDDGDCFEGLVCGEDNAGFFGTEGVDNVCWNPVCNTNRESYCGESTSACGECNPSGCQSDADCPGGLVCGIGAAALYGLAPGNICWDPICATDQQGHCGAGGLCGDCPCVGDCSGKACGDDPDDGCGGTCFGYCQDRDDGCTADYQCPAGSVCLPGQGPRIGLGEGVNICLPAECADAVPDLSQCGSVDDVCGLCPVCGQEDPCANTECGPDPFKCGVDCGGCSEGTCMGGACVLPPPPQPVDLPDPDQEGEVIEVEPLPPPETTVEVGALSGAFSVSDRGTATYDIPIVVPPGRAGMQPDIGLRYTSASGNGQLGEGWSLSGLSMITRCPRTQAVDGLPLPVVMSNNDALCIDGKRMHEMGTDDVTGGQLYGTEPTDFSKIVAFGSLGQGPEYFQVWTKGGRILYYGTKADSRVARLGEGTVRSWYLDRVKDHAGNTMDIDYESEGAFLYPDVPGGYGLPNICTLAVELDESVPPECENPEITVRRIAYGGFSDEDEGIEVAHTRFVEFEYMGRPDTIDGYRPAGGRFRRTQLLKSIETSVRTQPVRTYNLQYETASNGLSELSQIEECAHDEGKSKLPCKPATTFEYAPHEGFDEPINTGFVINPDPSKEPYWQIGDFDGNGTNDVLYRTCSDCDNQWRVLRSTTIGDGVGFESVTTSLSFPPSGSSILKPQVFAITGDALDDLIDLDTTFGQFGTSGSTSYSNQYRESSGYLELQDFIDFSSGSQAIALPDLNSLPKGIGQFADADGDGFADTVYCSGSASDSTWAYTQMVDGVPNQVPGAAYVELGLPGSSTDCTLEGQLAGTVDYDGDGRASVLVQLTEGNSTSTYAATLFQGGWRRILRGPAGKFADFNGDGLPDHYFHRSSFTGGGTVSEPYENAGVVVQIDVNKGAPDSVGQFFVADWELYPIGANQFGYVTALDENGDGYDDLLYQEQPQGEGTNWYIAYGAAKPLRNVQPFELGSSIGPPGSIRAADINADSSPDLLIVNAEGELVVRPGHSKRTNLLTKITDGLGKQHTIRYDAFGASGATYNVGDDCPYPTKCVRDPGPLVSEYDVSQVKGLLAGTGEQEFKQRQFRYTYRDAKTDTRGWGWLGFGQRTITEFDGAGDRISTTALFYHNGTDEVAGSFYPDRFVRAGLVKQSIVTSARAQSSIDHPNDVSERQVWKTNTWNTKTSTSPNEVEFPFLESSTTDVYEAWFTLAGDPTDSVLLWETVETFDVDSYDNPKTYNRVSGNNRGGEVLTLEGHFTNIDWEIREDDWLISLLHRVEDGDVQYPGEHGRTRTSEFTYDSHGLLETHTREPDDVENSAYYQLVTTYARTADSLWNVDTVTVDDVDLATPPRITALEYDDDNIFVERQTQQVDPVNHVTQFSYDTRHGLVSTIVSPGYVTTRMAYDGFGRLRLREQAGPTGDITTVDYEDAPVEPPFVRGVLRTRAHTITPHQGGSIDRTSIVDLDSFGRPVRTQRPAIGSVRREIRYDQAGRVQSISKHDGRADPFDPKPTTLFEYDARQRLVSERYPDQTSTSFDYAVTHGDAEDDYLLIPSTMASAATYRRVTAPEGNITLQAFDLRGNPVANYFNDDFADDFADVTTYEYAAYDALFRMTDAAGHEHLSIPDRYGRVELSGDLDRGPTENLFTAFGEVATSTVAAGSADDEVTTTFSYDALGRVLTQDNPVDGTVEFNYDLGPNGNVNDVGKLVKVMRDQEGHSEEYTYQPYEGVNNRGLLEEITRTVRTLKNPGGETIPRSYTTVFERDPGSGLVTVAQLPSAGSVEDEAESVLNLMYGYGPQGNVESVHSADGLGDSQDLYLWQLNDFHAGEYVSDFTLGGNTQGSGAIHAVLGYDDDTDEVLSLQYTDFNGGSVIDGASYTYDDNGNVKTVNRQVGNSEAYFYDALDRLTNVVTTVGSAHDVSYQYDSIGNIELVTDTLSGTTNTTNYAYDHASGRWPHAVRAAGDYEFEYTDRGAVETRTNTQTGTEQTFFYKGAFDLPRRIETTQGGTLTSATELEYSPFAERVIKRTRAPDDTIESEIEYIGDELEVHHNDDGYDYIYNVFVGGSQIARVSFAEQEGMPGVLSDASVEFLLTDNLGTPRSVTDLDGNVLRTQSATPFGRMSTLEGPGFTGHRHDQDLGLIDMRGRLYDPGVGRFMQADPIITAPFFSEGLNPYSYAFNSPANWTDPTGLQVGSASPICITQCATICPPSGGQCFQECNERCVFPDSGQAVAEQSNYYNNQNRGPSHGGGGAPSNAGAPPRGNQWGPGNTPGDLSPSEGNEQSGPSPERLRRCAPKGPPPVDPVAATIGAIALGTFVGAVVGGVANAAITAGSGGATIAIGAGVGAVAGVVSAIAIGGFSRENAGAIIAGGLIGAAGGAVGGAVGVGLVGGAAAGGAIAATGVRAAGLALGSVTGAATSAAGGALILGQPFSGGDAAASGVGVAGTIASDLAPKPLGLAVDVSTAAVGQGAKLAIDACP